MRKLSTAFLFLVISFSAHSADSACPLSEKERVILRFEKDTPCKLKEQQEKMILNMRKSGKVDYYYNLALRYLSEEGNFPE